LLHASTLRGGAATTATTADSTGWSVNAGAAPGEARRLGGGDASCAWHSPCPLPSP